MLITHVAGADSLWHERSAVYHGEALELRGRPCSQCLLTAPPLQAARRKRIEMLLAAVDMIAAY